MLGSTLLKTNSTFAKTVGIDMIIYAVQLTFLIG